MHSSKEWIIPTLAGMIVSLLRRFRRNRNEKHLIVFVRFVSHVSTCVFAGYVAGGVLQYLGYTDFISPGCALAGLFGTMAVDWIEETGLVFLSAWVKNKVNQ